MPPYKIIKNSGKKLIPKEKIFAPIILINENKKAHLGQTTPSCFDGCFGCGANVFGGGVCFEKI